MLGLSLADLPYLGQLIASPFFWLSSAFQLWMLIHAVRLREWLWALFILVFPMLGACWYFFQMYLASPGATRGFELPGAHDRRRIQELQSQIHHLDKAHHHAQLGDIYFQQGRLAQAEACYRAALEREPDDLDTRAHFGQCLLRQKKPAEARSFLEEVCAENPRHDYGHSLMALAETQTALGESGAAIATWRRVVDNHSYARARVQLAELLLPTDPVGARGLIEEVLSDAPHAPIFQRRRDRVWVRRAQALRRRAR